MSIDLLSIGVRSTWSPTLAPAGSSTTGGRSWAMLPRRVSAIGESNGTLPTGAHHDGSLPGRLPGVRPPALCVLRPRLQECPIPPRPAHPCHNHTPWPAPSPCSSRTTANTPLIGTRLLENDWPGSSLRHRMVRPISAGSHPTTGSRTAGCEACPGSTVSEVCRRIREFSDAYVIMVTGARMRSTA